MDASNDDGRESSRSFRLACSEFYSPAAATSGTTS